MDAIADNDVVVAQAGVTPGSAVHDALVSRADVMALTRPRCGPRTPAVSAMPSVPLLPCAWRA